MTPHTMIITDHTGDTQVTWNPVDDMSVEEIRNRFSELIEAGCFAYETDDPKSSEGTQVKKFNPLAKFVYVHRGLVGG